MKKRYEYIFPFNREESFAILEQCGSQMPQWVLVSSDADACDIEWTQKVWALMDFSTIKVTLKETNKSKTIATISISRQMQLVDPFRMCDRVYKKFRLALDSAVSER